MHKHHAESIENMIAHYRANPEIKALILIGSVVTGTERPDSDIDAVAVVSQGFYECKKEARELEESHWGKCTYEGGYFDVKYMSREVLEELAQNGAEPMRNTFDRARFLFCDDADLPELVAKIPVFQKSEAPAKQLRFYCAMKMFRRYFWTACKPDGFARLHTAHGIIYNLYRLILIENEILFPSTRKLEPYVGRAPNKPDRIIEKCGRFMETLSDEDCAEVVKSYEEWTSYDYPKENPVIVNHFSNPYEWE
jgi:predicted nucleotidyltransferase